MESKIIPMPDSLAKECAGLMAANDPWKKVGRTIEDCVSNFSNPSYQHYILMHDDQVKGFLIVILNGLLGGGFIKSLFVSPELQGAGLGKKLLEFGEGLIFAQFANSYLCVSSFNKNAQLFYKNNGYAIVGELSELIVPGHAEILLRKTKGPTSQYVVKN